ncbi:MAG: AAA family ATPase, partial [Planctomycetota bacterium]|nr:AAA family ATPase [Planctomycetota bacterium]
MIIRSIKAENFMKFARLSLTGLPDNGVIGILGPNESGKSTIGEAILFAFFGQSRMSKDSPLESLIHWGSEYMRIEIDFVLGIEPGKKRLLRVYREIDRFGTNYAKIMELPGKEEVARGNREVTAFIQNHIGFDLFEFHHAFYHDQYGSRQVDDSQREFLERMTGVRQMESATERIGTEIEQLEREFGHYQKDIGRNLKQIERFSRTSERIPELREEEEKSVCDYVRVKDAVEVASRVNDAFRGLQGSGNGGGRGFKQLAAARGAQLEDGVNGLLEDYKVLQSRCLEGDLEDSELAAETEKICQALERTNEFLDAYKDLRRNCIEAREVLESELYGSAESSLKTRLVSLEQQKAGLAASMSSRFKALVLAAVFFFLFAAVAVVISIKPALLESLSESLDPRYLQFGCGGLGILSLIFMMMKF